MMTKQNLFFSGLQSFLIHFPHDLTVTLGHRQHPPNYSQIHFSKEEAEFWLRLIASPLKVHLLALPER